MIKYNEKHHGIEVKFAAKPPMQTIEKLKSLGFRWHRQNRYWYAKFSPNKWAELTADPAPLHAVNEHESRQEGASVGGMLAANGII